jgi:isopentenyl-diphosphate delta-isomerase
MAEELIVLVDKDGKPVGTAEKLDAHNANTPLHLAFSCYVFNDVGQLLITQRAASKKVFPGVWSNSVCGHPAPGESMQSAIERRLQYELGMKARDFKLVIADYLYKTPPFNGIIEHEFCPIYFATSNQQPAPNPSEVQAFKWLTWPEYIKELEADQADKFSWWSKDQLQLLLPMYRS